MKSIALKLKRSPPATMVPERAGLACGKHFPGEARGSAASPLTGVTASGIGMGIPVRIASAAEHRDGTAPDACEAAALLPRGGGFALVFLHEK